MPPRSLHTSRSQLIWGTFYVLRKRVKEEMEAHPSLSMSISVSISHTYRCLPPSLAFSFLTEKDWMIWKMDGEQFWQQDLNKSWYVPKSQQAGQQAPQNRYTMNRQPWTERFHLVFNLAVGGWFLDGPDFVSGDYNTSSWSNPEMLVDWVEVFQRADGCQMEGVFPREICGVKESLEASTFCGSVGWGQFFIVACLCSA